MVAVWLSMPMIASGQTSGPSRVSKVHTTFAKRSRLIWWQMPLPGGTTLKPLNAFCAQRRKV